MPLIPAVSDDEARDGLRSIYQEFHFQTESDRSRAIAALLTPAMKHSGFLDGPSPISIIEADQSQAGKGIFPQIHGALYGVEQFVVARRSGGVGSMDESLATNFIKGGSLIHIDNVRGKLQSEYLEAALTARSSFPARIPQMPEIDVDVSNTALYLTSNGFESTFDLGNRASIIRIRKRDGHRYSDIPGQIRQQRGFYLGCLLQIIESYWRSGAPRTEEARHTFYHWAQPLDWIVQNLFGLPPLLDGHEAAQTTLTNPAMSFLRRVAIAVAQAGRLSTPLRASVGSKGRSWHSRPRGKSGRISSRV